MTFRTLCLVSSLVTSFAFTPIAQANDKNIEVTPIQDVTSQELAAIYVISEICPSIASDQTKFSSGLEKLLKEYLPNEKDPLGALKKMTQANDFKPILEEARNDAKNAGAEKNQAICEELVTYKN